MIASKGRFDRALAAAERAVDKWPSEGTANADEFMEATTDLWHIPSESATRVGHPAPFPVALPEGLIDLYIYRGDLVLDPFMGAGTTAMAAVRTGCHFVGFDTDSHYIELAGERIAEEQKRISDGNRAQRWEARVAPSTNGAVQSRLFDEADESLAPSSGRGRVRASGPDTADDDFQARAVREGRKAQERAYDVLDESGFRNIRPQVAVSHGVEVNYSANDRQGNGWLFDVSGAFSVTRRPGLRRTDTLWKAIGKAAVLHNAGHGRPLVLLTTDRPAPNSAGHRALEAVTGPGKPIRAVIEMDDPNDLERLAEFASGQA